MVNEGSLQLSRFGSAGNAHVNNTIILNSSQQTAAPNLFLRAQPADTLLNYTYTSGRIIAVNNANIDWDPGADDRVHKIADLEIQQSGGIGNGPVNGTQNAVLRIALNRNRSILAAGSLTVTSNATLNVDTTQAVASLAAYSTNGAYLSNGLSSGLSVAELVGSQRLSKWGDGYLYIRGASPTFSGKLVIDQGAVHVTDNGSLGSGPVEVNRFGTLDIGVANFVPTNSSLTYNEGSIERWSVDSPRSGAINLGKATLQVAANQPTTNATITLNGGGIEAWLRNDDHNSAQVSGGVLRVLNPNVNFDLAGDSFVGARHYLGANGLDMGRQTNDNRPMEEYLASGAILEIQGVIGGVGGLTKAGLDTVILSGSNTYAGMTFIEGGKLMIGRDDALPTTTTLSTTANGVIDLNGQNQTVGALTNPVVVAGANSTSGFITNSGTVIKTLTVGNGAVLDSTYSGVIQHNIALKKTGPATLTLNNVNTYRGHTEFNEGAIAIASEASLGQTPALFEAQNLTFTGGALATTVNMTLSANRGLHLAAASGTLAPAAGTTLTIISPISGAAFVPLIKNGEGTLVLNTTALTYSGDTRVIAGTLRQGVAGAFLSSSRYVIGGDVLSGSLDLNGFDTTLGSLDSVGANPENGQVLIGSNLLTLGADNTSTGVFGGVISGVGGALLKVGTGRQTLSGINTFTGSTTIEGGILAIATEDALGPEPLAPTANHLILSNGGLLGNTNVDLIINDLNRGILLAGTGGGFSPTLGTTITVFSPITGTAPLIIGGEGSLVLAGVNTGFEGAISLTGGVLSIDEEADLGANPGAFNPAQLNFDGGTLQTTVSMAIDDNNRGITLAAGGGTFLTDALTSLTVSNVITGPGSLTKTGPGALVLSAVNTYTGGTTISQGVLSIASEESIGSNPLTPGTGDLTLDGGTLLTTANFTMDDANRGVVFNAINSGIEVQTLTTLSIANGISGVGGFTKLGEGTLVLQNAGNTYQGTTQVADGVLEIAAPGALGTTPVALAPGQVTLNGGALRTTATMDLGSTRGLTVDASGGEVEVASATSLTLSAPITGAGALTKSGLGTALLTANSTHTGDLTVGAGALFLDDVSLVSNTVTVATGATFGGTGTVAGPVALTNGTGAGAGEQATLSVGAGVTSGLDLLTLEDNLTLGDFAIVDFYLSKTGFTQLATDGLVTIAPTTKFRINLDTGYSPSEGSFFQLVDWGTNTFGILGSEWINYFILPTLPQFAWDTTQFGLGQLRVTGVATGPVVTDPASGVVLYGDPITFSATVSGSDPIFVQWYKGVDPIPGATSTTYTIPYVTTADIAGYKMVATNGTATAESDVALLDVVTAPRFTTPLADIGAFAQTSPVLSVDVLAPGDVTYVWFVDNGTGYEQISGASGTGPAFASYTVPALVPNAPPVNYKVVVTAEIDSLVFGPEESEMTLTVLDGITIESTGQPEDVTASEGRTASFTVAAAGDFGIGQTDFTYQWQTFNGVSWEPISGATAATLNVTVPAVVAGAEGGRFRVVVSNPYTSLTSDEAVLTVGVAQVILAGPGTPAAQILRTGENLEISINPVGALPMTFQWLLNGAPIPGQTTNTLWIPSVTTTNVGLYSCVVSNSYQTATGRATSTQTTVQVPVTVVDGTERYLTSREPGKAKLTVVARTPSSAPMTYQWHDQNGPIAGQTGTSLTLAGLTAGSYSYFCAVSTVAAGTANSGTTRLQVFNTAPTWPSPALATTSATSRLPLPGAKVSQPYFYQVPLPGQSVTTNSDDTVTASGTANGAAAPSSFRATGLPAGLRINSEGQITGAATVDGTFNVTITMTNGITPAPAPLFATLVIAPINANVIGEFTGPVERHPLNGNLGGMVSVKTTKNGAYTGRLTMGALGYSFKGALVSGAGGPNPVATVTISRGRTLPALVMNFALDAATQLVSVGEIKEITDRLSSNVATFTGWRYTWLKTKVNPTPALVYSGYYTLGLDLPLLLQGTSSNPTIPQGNGYASFTVNSGTGRATVSGRLSDGSAFTTATYVGPTGELLVFRTLYSTKARGSVLGSLVIDDLVPNDLDDNTLAGTVSWFKPAQAGRTYAAEFGPFDLTAAGSRYVAPVTGTPVMGITPPAVVGQVNALVELLEANVEGALPTTLVPAANQTGFSVSTSNRAVADVVNNPRKVTLVINAKTGAVSGRFTLSQGHPFGGTPAVINRTVSYQAMIVQNGSVQQGWGYFLLPQLPANISEKVTATPILSGQATFQKVP